MNYRKPQNYITSIILFLRWKLLLSPLLLKFSSTTASFDISPSTSKDSSQESEFIYNSSFISWSRSEVLNFTSSTIIITCNNYTTTRSSVLILNYTLSHSYYPLLRQLLGRLLLPHFPTFFVPFNSSLNTFIYNHLIRAEMSISSWHIP